MPTTLETTATKEFKARILAYGPSQCGKTTFLGTLPEDRDDHKGRYIINMEGNNILPLHMAGKKFEWDNVNTYEALLKLLVKIRARFDKKEADVPASVSLDGGGEMYKSIMYYIVKNAGVEQPQIQHYYTAQTRMLSLIDELMTLPCHTAITFHDIIDKDELTGEIFGSLSLPGKYLPNDILKKFNMVLHFEVDTKKDAAPVYKVCTKRTKRFSAGDKTDALDMYEEPDFKLMYAKIKKKLDSVDLRSK